MVRDKQLYQYKCTVFILFGSRCSVVVQHVSTCTKHLDPLRWLTSRDRIVRCPPCRRRPEIPATAAQCERHDGVFTLTCPGVAMASEAIAGPRSGDDQEVPPRLVHEIHPARVEQRRRLA